MAEKRMSQAAAKAVRSQFKKTASSMERVGRPVSRCSTDLEAGAGSMSNKLTTGLRTFEIGWRRLSETAATAADIIATNTNNLKLDLDKVDAAYADAGGPSSATKPRGPAPRGYEPPPTLQPLPEPTVAAQEEHLPDGRVRIWPRSARPSTYWSAQ
jgi:hypothetical protein